MAPIIILTIGVSGTFGTPPKGGVSRLSRLSPPFMADIWEGLSRLSRLSRSEESP
jgi:hypothetical protein